LLGLLEKEKGCEPAGPQPVKFVFPALEITSWLDLAALDYSTVVGLP
jgi:hypothetical protein